jgi:hypothetical protein
MGLFGRLIGDSSESVALIDVQAGSVGGGYLAHPAGMLPTLAYSTRVPVEPREHESVPDAVIRSVATLIEQMKTDGVTALARLTGSGRTARTVISIGSPWQESKVRIERLQQSQPFTFTRSLMSSIVGKTAEVSPDRIGCGESVVATILNGYETSQPFGKRAQLADIVVLSSTIERAFVDRLMVPLRDHSGLHDEKFTASAPLIYQVFRHLFPHEKRFLVVAVSRDATDIMMIRNGLLSSIIRAPHGVGTFPRADATKSEDRTDTGAAMLAWRADWVGNVRDAFLALCRDAALPRALFLIAEDEYRSHIASALDVPALRSLWLSDESLSVIPVEPAHFTREVSIGESAKSDMFLMMLALFHSVCGK